jgi:hypothetical protein
VYLLLIYPPPSPHYLLLKSTNIKVFTNDRVPAVTTFTQHSLARESNSTQGQSCAHMFKFRFFARPFRPRNNSPIETRLRVCFIASLKTNPSSTMRLLNREIKARSESMGRWQPSREDIFLEPCPHAQCCAPSPAHARAYAGGAWTGQGCHQASGRRERY